LEKLARDGDLIHADQAFQKLELEMGRLTEALVTYAKAGGDKALGATN
jgi:hypothetical protein